MPKLHVSLAYASLLLGGSTGCGSGEGERGADADSGELATSAGSPTAAPPRPGADTVMPQPIHWSSATVEATLRAAGFEPVLGSLHGSDPFPNVPAAVYRIGNADARAFFFADPVAAARARGRLGQPSSEESVFTSNNMVVLLVGGSARMRDEIRRALTVPEVEGAVNR